MFDPRGAEAYSTVRRVPRGENTLLGAVHRRPQQKAGEICGQGARRAAGAQRALAGAFLFLAVGIGGCAHGGGPRAASVANAIEADLAQCHLERESHISLGGISMFAVKTLVKLAGDPDTAQFLGDVKRVEQATYRVIDSETCPDLTQRGRFESELGRAGWQLMVTEKDDCAASWVFSRARNDGSISGLYVVTLDRYELEVVRLEGRIDEILAEAIKEEPERAADMVSAGS
jgi:hypothetical protein